MSFILILFILLNSILSPSQSMASVDALKISDFIKSEKPGLYFADENFSIHTEKTNWFQLDPLKIKSKFIKTEYHSLDINDVGKLTVRIDKTNKNYSLKRYLRSSLKDYNRFGFKILETRSLALNNNQALILDLKKNSSQIQTRQILFKKENTVVILTCSGHENSFQSHLKDCNQIARNFNWN